MPDWKDYIDSRGYVHIWLRKDHPFYCMADYQGYVRRNRLVMAESFGFPLPKEWRVHHKWVCEAGSGNVIDDSIGNLVCFSGEGLHKKWEALLRQHYKIIDKGFGENRSQSKLTNADVLLIRKDIRSQKEIANDFGVHPSTISRVRNRKRWTHI